MQVLIIHNSIKCTLHKIDSITPDDIFISEKIINHLLAIIEQTRIKLILFFQQHLNAGRAPPEFHAYTLEDTVDYLLNYPVPDNEHPLKGALHLSVLYYEIQGSYRNNARFLFGTASQFCR